MASHNGLFEKRNCTRCGREVSRNETCNCPITGTVETVDRGEKYFKTIIGAREGKIDVYGVAHTFGLTAGRYHALKKLLCSGQRGVKDEVTDLREAITAIEREIEILEVNEE